MDKEARADFAAILIPFQVPAQEYLPHSRCRTGLIVTNLLDSEAQGYLAHNKTLPPRTLQ